MVCSDMIACIWIAPSEHDASLVPESDMRIWVRRDVGAPRHAARYATKPTLALHMGSVLPAQFVSIDLYIHHDTISRSGWYLRSRDLNDASKPA